jgi:hypothetical protein
MGGEVQTGLALSGAIALLAIWAIIFWFVVAWIGATANAVWIVRALIVGIACAYSLYDIIGSYRAGPPQLSPSGYLSTPNIMAPERR